MRYVTLSEELERSGFANRAAIYFANHPEKTSYTDGNIKPEAWFGLRFGLDNDCVVVFKVGEDEPVNYQNLVSLVSKYPTGSFSR